MLNVQNCCGAVTRFFFLITLWAWSTVHYVDQSVAIDFTTLPSLLHLANAENFQDDVHMRRVLQAAFSITGNFLELVRCDSETSKFADDMKQELNTIYQFGVSILITNQIWASEHTLFAKVVRLLVHDTGGPPFGLGLLRVTGSTGGRSSWRFATVVRVPHLLARLNELDEGLGDHAAI
jgi:hypothetical protein